MVRSPRLITTDWVLLLLLAWAAFSLQWTLNFHEGLWRVVHWGAVFAIYLVVSRGAPEPWMRALFLSGVAVSLVGLAQVAGLEWPARWEVHGATLANPNMAAHVVVLLMPFGLVSRHKWGWAVMLAYLWFADSLTAWIALGFMLFIGAYTLLKWRKRVFILALVAVPILLPPDISLSPSFEHRLAIWTNTLPLIADNPLGVGVGGWGAAYSGYAQAVISDPVQSLLTTSQRAHNDWLQLTAELGWPGVVLILVLLGWLIPRLPVKYRIHPLTGPGPIFTRTHAAAGLSLLGLGVVMAGSFPLERAIPPLIGAIALGALFPGPRGRRRFWVLGAPIFAMLVTAHIWLIEADWLQKQAHNAILDKNYIEGGDYAARAMQLSPFHVTPPAQMGIAMMLMKRWPEATQAFETAAKRRPDLPRVLWHLMLASHFGKQPEKALEAFKRLEAILPPSKEMRKAKAMLNV